MTLVTRLTAWAAVALIVLAGIAADVVPTVHAGLVDAVSLCTPADVRGMSRPDSTPCPDQQAATLLVPRCGVA
jgi:hypothetical protein